MVATASDATSAIFHRLDGAVGVERVLIEPRVGFGRIFWFRARRLGVRAAVGQALFRLVIVPVLERRSAARRAQIAEQAGLDLRRIPPDRLTHVPSVNDERTIAVLAELSPRVVVVAGTRIISERVLQESGAPFVNLHAGITPGYRGVHGGYWALAMNDPDHCGVTVHLVDCGVDTGDILAQAAIEPGDADDFTTYPWLQLAAGLPILVEAVRRLMGGGAPGHAPVGPSRHWFHPTVWGYLARRFRCGIR